MISDKISSQKIILAIVILLAFVGIVAYSISLKKYPPVAVQPTVSPTVTPTPVVTVIPSPTPITDISDWKTYQNEQYKYEVKYPKDWQVIYLKDLYPGNTSIALRSPKYQPIKDGEVTHVGEIYISGIDNPKNLSIKDLFATFNDTARFWFDEFEHKDVTINGNSGVIFDNIAENSSSNIIRTEAYIKGEKKVINVSYLFLENPNREVYDKILSTFKFIK